MIRVVLFDIDGTLVRTGGAGTKAFERTLAMEFKIPKAIEGINFAGRTDTGLVRECFQMHRIDPTPKNFERFFENYIFWLDRCLEESNGRLCPGALSCLEAFAKQTDPPLVGLLTGNIRLGAEIKLRHYGLWDFFHVGAFADDHESRNELAKIASRRAGEMLDCKLASEQILVIGDTPRDIECARTIGAKMLAVATGEFSKAQLEKHRPTWTVENLTQASLGKIWNDVTNSRRPIHTVRKP